MTTQKLVDYIIGLTADATPTSDDLVLAVDAPGGTPANKKVTLAGKVEVIQVAVMDVYVALNSAMKPDADGSVRLTADEVTAIKVAVGKLLAIFGITLPI